MADVPASLKWGKASYPDRLVLRPGASGRGLKVQVESLTGVPVGRQKLLCPKVWRGALGDDDDLPGDVPAGKKRIVVTLIGSAESLAEKPPEERPRFAEDMTPQELWEATRSKTPGEAGDACDIVDIVALQLEAGMDRDDGKMEMYQYNRMVNGLPQHQINDMLASRKKQRPAGDGDGSGSTSSSSLSGEVVMTMGMELRRAYINSLAVLPSGTVVSGLDDGHVQLWRRGRLVKDARHPTGGVDHVLAFPSSTVDGPSFVTAGDGSICLWTEEGERLMRFPSYPGTTPASIAAGSIGEANGTYLASCFAVTRQVDPNQFRLVPQNEAERRRREAAEARERLLQNELWRVSRSVKLWMYGGGPDRAGALTQSTIKLDEPEDTAPATKLLDMDGRLVSGDGWGCLRTFEWAQGSESSDNPPSQWRQRSLVQFRGCGVACMAHLEGRSLAVSIQPENDAGTVPSASPLPVARGRCICILDTDKATVNAVLDAHSDTVRCICPLPDGGILTAGGRMDATVRVWDPPSLASKDSDADGEAKVITEAKTLKQPGYVFDLKVLPDSRGSGAYAVAAARYNVIKIVL